MKKINWWAVLYFTAIILTVYFIVAFVGLSLNPIKTELQRIILITLVTLTFQNLSKK